MCVCSGFANVYQAMWEGAPVAVKVLLPDYSSKANTDVLKMFIREAKTMSCCTHR